MVETKGYFIDSYRVTEEQYRYIEKLTAGFNKSTRRLFCHILASTLLKLSGLGAGAWTPVASELIKTKLRGASWQALEKRGLIEATGFSIAEHRSREYSVAKSVIDRFVDFTRGLSAEQIISLPCVNLFTGRAMRKPEGNVLRDDSGNALPELYIKAVETIRNNGAIFYLKRVEAHVRALEAEYEKAQAEFDKAEALGFGGAYLEERRVAEARAWGRWLNDYLCFECILQQKPKQITDELWIYPPAYKATMSGRLSHLRGGFQSCSAEMKAAAFAGVPDVHNVDLEASQVNGLIQLLEIAGLDSSWLVTYRDTSNQKKVYAERAGMSINCWKRCLLALCMGGTMPKRLVRLADRDNSIIEFVRNECDSDIAITFAILEKFGKVVEPLVEVLSQWHTWLLSDYVPATKKAGRGGWFLTNKVGIKLNITAYLRKFPIWKVKATLAAFLLQGQESAFIHTLTILGAKYGYKAMGNEHDGLIVLGTIPDEAVAEAARLSGLQNAKLVEKPFAMREVPELAEAS
jgi:hypothetical protein